MCVLVCVCVCVCVWGGGGGGGGGDGHVPSAVSTFSRRRISEGMAPN